MEPYSPFCGTPPIPAELLTRWTFNPWLIMGLLGAFCVGIVLLQAKAWFAAVWLLVTLLFVSPLCAASMALFSARVAQHILLTLVAAPLLAAILPKIRVAPMAAALSFAVLFWFWHAPAPYRATLESDLTYWSMHLSLFGVAVAMFAAFRAAPEHSVLAATLTGAQLTIFASVLTLSPTAWHDWHLLTTVPYGLSALSDQQLAGALMWVAGGGVFMVSVAGLARRFLHRPPPGMEGRVR